MIPSQMLKGILEGCILKVIDQEETYAYEISQKLKHFGFGEISEGTIYPIILRLNKSKQLNGVLRKSKIGPQRKYYRLTQEGKLALKEFEKNWIELQLAIQGLFSGEVRKWAEKLKK